MPRGEQEEWERAVAQAEARARTRVVAQAGDRAVARAEALVRALKMVRPLVDDDQAERYSFSYDEVLVDSTLAEIIYSIQLDNRQRLAQEMSHRSYALQEYQWFIQIITPITRLPPELLHQILLIVIDDANHSPSVLMRVSKLWYTIVTSVWASLRLGTTTPKDVVTNMLERNQWFLDVSVDTEVDRSDFAPSEGAYDAIFAAIQATSRWRSFVVRTFPAQADLSEQLVNRRF